MTKRHKGTIGQATTVVDIGLHSPRRTPEEVIGSRVQPQPNGCWLYDGDADAYGRSSAFPGTPVSVHRFVYETLVGPIGWGYHLHHTCETPGCCNPAHLMMVTPAEHAEQHAQLRRRD